MRYDLIIAHVRKVKRLASNFYGVSIQDIEGHSKARRAVMARRGCMLALRNHTDMSLESIGSFFSMRPHNSVSYTLSRCEREDNMFAEMCSLSNICGKLSESSKKSRN